MKLKVPKLYSQRNSLWSSILLGYNTSKYTIGSDGCLITSFGMYVDKTPDEVNKLLKDNGGYAAGGGLFIWSKSTVLGLNQVYQSPYYSDAVTSQGLSKMRSLLDEGRPLICHVDFNPSTVSDEMHWILVYGYDDNDIFYAKDPWSGTDITLDVYGGVKRAVIEWKAYDKILSKDTGVDEMTQCRTDRDQNHNDRMALYEELGFTGVFNRTIAVEKIRQLLALEKSFVQKDEQLKIANEKIDTLEEKVKKAEENLTKFADESTKTIQTLTEENQSHLRAIQELKDTMIDPSEWGANKLIVTGIKKWLGLI